MAHQITSPFALLAPPYRKLLPLDVRESFPQDSSILQGTALIWQIRKGQGNALLDRVAKRPPGLPLMVVLPPAEHLPGLRERVLAVAEDARPQTVLPFHPRLIPEEMASLLRREPSSLPDEFVDFLRWRGLPLDQETRRIVKRTAELSVEIRTLKALARGIYLSRRALGRRFQKRGLPVPSHWLQFCRLLRAAIRLQNSRNSLFEVACSLGYPDGFTLSNQMDRLVGVRPSVVRKRLGWEWFVEAWLRREWLEGGLEVRLRGLPDRPSETGSDNAVTSAEEGGKTPTKPPSGDGEDEAAGPGTAERSEAA
jgi:AraC-like DNA-binding protein